MCKHFLTICLWAAYQHLKIYYLTLHRDKQQRCSSVSLAFALVVLFVYDMKEMKIDKQNHRRRPRATHVLPVSPLNDICAPPPTDDRGDIPQTAQT